MTKTKTPLASAEGCSTNTVRQGSKTALLRELERLREVTVAASVFTLIKTRITRGKGFSILPVAARARLLVLPGLGAGGPPAAAIGGQRSKQQFFVQQT